MYCAIIENHIHHFDFTFKSLFLTNVWAAEDVVTSPREISRRPNFLASKTNCEVTSWDGNKKNGANKMNTKQLIFIGENRVKLNTL